MVIQSICGEKKRLTFNILNTRYKYYSHEYLIHIVSFLYVHLENKMKTQCDHNFVNYLNLLILQPVISSETFQVL